MPSVANARRPRVIGIAGVVALLGSWTVLFFPWRILPPRYDPLLLLSIIILGGCAGIAGIVVGSKTLTWWYLLAAAGFLTAAILLVWRCEANNAGAPLAIIG